MNDDAKQLLAKYEPKETEALHSDYQLGCARFSPDGAILAAGAYDATVRRWALTEHGLRPLAAMNGHNGWVSVIAFSPAKERSLLYSADTWGGLIARPAVGQWPRPVWSHDQAHDGWVRDLAVSPDGKTIATGGRDKLVKLWSASDGKPLRTLEGHEHEVWCVAFHPTQNVLVSGDFHGNIKRWDLDTGEQTGELDATDMYMLSRLQDVCGLRLLRFSADGKLLYAGGAAPARGGRLIGKPTIYVFDLETGEKSQTVAWGADNSGYVFDLTEHPGGFLMCAVCAQPGKGSLAFIRPGDEEPFYDYTKLANPHALAVHPDGRRLAVTATNRNSQGNGRREGPNGDYPGNYSPVHLFEMPAGDAG